MQPTSEQQESIDVFMGGYNMKINAYAGSGKTSTLQLLARERSSPGVYLCFNKSIAEEAQKRFPDTVACKTTHSFAYRAVVRKYNNSNKMTGSLRARDTAEFLKIRSFPILGGTASLADSTLGFVVNQTVKKFCMSADLTLDNQHFHNLPKFHTLPSDEFHALRTRVVQWAQALWNDMESPQGAMPLGHDGYVKVWQLSEPVIDTCFILVDEAQDTNPVMLDVLRRQECQIVYVGDKHQQIYEWRGAINAMETVPVKTTVNLTKSFRFGQAIADFASDVLATIGETCRITGNEAIKSQLTRETQKAILCRTNGQILDTILDMAEYQRDKSIHVVGGVEDLVRCLEGVERLMDKRPSPYPMFMGFKDWDEFLLYSQASGDTETQKITKLVNKYGTKELKSALGSIYPSESHANILLTTAHKAKGREWQGVEMAEDFKAQPEKNEANEMVYNGPETRLFYVAATRAITNLKVPSWAMVTYGVKLPAPVPAEEKVSPVTISQETNPF